MLSLVVLLYYALELLKWLIIIRALMSWFIPPHSDNPLARMVHRLTDPILRPFSEMVPSIGGVDLSALAAIVAIHLFQRVLILM